MRSDLPPLIDRLLPALAANRCCNFIASILICHLQRPGESHCSGSLPSLHLPRSPPQTTRTLQATLGTHFHPTFSNCQMQLSSGALMLQSVGPACFGARPAVSDVSTPRHIDGPSFCLYAPYKIKKGRKSIVYYCCAGSWPRFFRWAVPFCDFGMLASMCGWPPCSPTCSQ